MNRFLLQAGLVAAGAATALVVAARPAAAQIDPMLVEIHQHGVKVGEIFVPPHATANDYVEHWVLFPGYVYPSVTAEIVTTLVCADRKFASAEDFFRHVPFAQGSRYVLVSAHDTDQLPVPNSIR
jgi:hypothetical protein